MGRRATGVCGWAVAIAIAASVGLDTPASAAGATSLFHEDFSGLAFGEWTAPPAPGYALRGPMFTEYPVQSDGTVGPVLTTRGLYGGERVLFPVAVDAARSGFTFDVDFQRVAAIVDSALMWHVTVDPATGAQRYYQVAILHGAKPGISPTLRIQYVEESTRFERGFSAVTLAETHGPTITPYGWHHWRVRAEPIDPEEFVVTLDGTDLLSARDQRLGTGRFGVRVGLDLTRWDNVDVSVSR